jgi:hypothetical protein
LGDTKGEVRWGAKKYIELVERYLDAIRARDERTYAADYAENAVVRMAGVPRP